MKRQSKQAYIKPTAEVLEMEPEGAILTSSVDAEQDGYGKQITDGWED